MPRGGGCLSCSKSTGGHLPLGRPIRPVTSGPLTGKENCPPWEEDLPLHTSCTFSPLPTWGLDLFVPRKEHKISRQSVPPLGPLEETRWQPPAGHSGLLLWSAWSFTPSKPPGLPHWNVNIEATNLLGIQQAAWGPPSSPPAGTQNSPPSSPQPTSGPWAALLTVHQLLHPNHVREHELIENEEAADPADFWEASSLYRWAYWMWGAPRKWGFHLLPHSLLTTTPITILALGVKAEHMRTEKITIVIITANISWWWQRARSFMPC